MGYWGEVANQLEQEFLGNCDVDIKLHTQLQKSSTPGLHCIGRNQYGAVFRWDGGVIEPFRGGGIKL